ncbi:sm-like ribonucleoprotein [Teratosphaeria destructans]|uniref:Sm-like ribonucleoprotein n=1 Tax=Teratosphaeria destructans TaxID=418781 RepID=A0A9W7W493_9PEZI|nr:sm-like ribonucleoprotein [Teratosphaeria destructans]
MTSTIGIPIKLLNEATGHQVTVEIDSGQTYRGKLIEAEDNMNCQLENINVTQRDGRVTHLDRVYIRGSHVRLFIVPDMLRNAPMFRARGTRGRGVGLARGRATMDIDIKQPLRILAIGAPGSRILSIIQDLTGSAPALNPEGTTAGLIHTWEAHTAYYTASIPIWIDEISDAEAWTREFLKPEAKEVVQAVGAWIYCCDADEHGGVGPGVESIMRGVQAIVEEHGGVGGDGARLAVCMPPREGVEVTVEAWEDACLDHGFEFVQYGAEGKNEYGEEVGFARLKEALEANEWAADGEDLGFEGGGDAFDDFGLEEAEWTSEFCGVQAALADGRDGDGDGEAEAVEDLERLMGRLLAVKEMAGEVSQAQRRRMAARAVGEVMGRGGEEIWDA